jgi:hypothetical protein
MPKEKKPKPAKDPNALTKHQATLRDKIAGCGGVFCSRSAEAIGDAATWYFVGRSGRPNPDTIGRLIRKGALVPQNDGLFPGDSQTYVARPA